MPPIPSEPASMPITRKSRKTGTPIRADVRLNRTLRASSRPVTRRSEAVVVRSAIPIIYILPARGRLTPIRPPACPANRPAVRALPSGRAGRLAGRPRAAVPSLARRQGGVPPPQAAGERMARPRVAGLPGLAAAHGRNGAPGRPLAPAGATRAAPSARARHAEPVDDRPSAAHAGGTDRSVDRRRGAGGLEPGPAGGAPGGGLAAPPAAGGGAGAVRHPPVLRSVPAAATGRHRLRPAPGDDLDRRQSRRPRRLSGAPLPDRAVDAGQAPDDVDRGRGAR